MHDASWAPVQLPATPVALLTCTPQVPAGVGTMTGAPGAPTQLAFTCGSKVTVKLAAALRPAASVVVHETVVVPSGNVLPEAGVQVADTGGGTQGGGGPGGPPAVAGAAHDEQLPGLSSWSRTMGVAYVTAVGPATVRVMFAGTLAITGGAGLNTWTLNGGVLAELPNAS